MNRLAWLSGICAVLLIFIAVPAFAQGTATFDHSKTAFPLTGAHIAVECVTCHLNGVLKGTPTQCAACHNGTLAQGMPAGHLPSSASCDTCHRNTVTFANAPMNHAGISSNCTSCHNGQSFYGVTPVSKTSIHMTTTQDCVTCHRSFVSFAGAAFTHPANAAGQCYTCHGSGQAGAMMENAGHVQTGSASCDICHTSTAPAGFAIYTMGANGHAQLGVTMGTSDCTSCHSGSYFGVIGKSASHIATTANCSACHNSFVSFGGASYVHSASAAGNCNSCHLTGSGGAMTMVSSHAPINGAQCDACHTSTATGGFAIYTMGTTGHTAAGITSTTQDCTACHAANYFGVVIKPSTHVATSSNCSTSGCHSSFTSFAGATYTHQPTDTNCNQCHIAGNAVGAMVEVSNHVPTGTILCSACHTSQLIGGFASYTLASVHSALSITTGSTNCASCHAASYFGVTIKPTSHIATTQDCSACHTNLTSFAGASYSHPASASGTCYTCHVPGNTMGAMVENTGHVATLSQSCDVCHKSTATGGFATYTMGSTGHAALSVLLSSNCMTCHNGTVFGTKTFKPHPGSHGTTATTANFCGNCHKSFTSDPGGG